MRNILEDVSFPLRQANAPRRWGRETRAGRWTSQERKRSF